MYKAKPIAFVEKNHLYETYKYRVISFKRNDAQYSVLILGIDPLKSAAVFIDPSNRFVNSNLYHKKSQSQSIDLNFKY